jgi:3-hydroxyisobutyrate dehydrogenase-like beta-hydroxyacid dehydrogenase
MTHRMRKNVGVIGLGIIGSRVAAHLREGGFHVFVWNRTLRRVPNFVGTPAEIAEMCDYVQIFVSDDDALLDVTNQLTSGLAPRHIVLAHSTVSPHSMRAAAEIVERRGARFIEAPFTGSKMAAEKGELVYYVGGDDAALREARPILEASSKEIMVIGEIGQATAVKIATNMVTAASVEAAAEALALAQTVGLSLDKFVEAMRGNASYSQTLAMKLPKMIEANFEPHFSLKHMLKDMQIASRLGLSHYLELAVTGATRERLLEQMQRGYGDDDYCAIARKYFPDVRPASCEEADLELFDLPPIVPFTVVQSEAEGPQEDQPGSGQPEAETGALAPPSEFAPLSASLEEPEVPQKKNDAAPSEETSAASLPHESLEEETQPRRSAS